MKNWERLSVTLMFRLLLAIHPEENHLCIRGWCKALPHFLPPKWLGLHICRTHIPLPKSPGATLFRFVPMMSCRLCAMNIPDVSKKSKIQMLAPFSESANGLCCRLTEPCFIKTFENSREAKPGPTTVRRPTINWKNISRFGRFFLLLPLLMAAVTPLIWVCVKKWSVSPSEHPG